MCVEIGQIVNRRGSIHHFRKETGTGFEMCPASVSGRLEMRQSAIRDVAVRVVGS